MASNNSSNPPLRPTFQPSPNSSNPNSIPNTTFVQADPSSFRAIVQNLTGKPNSGEMGLRRPAFKLHERRPTARKLEIELNNGGRGGEHMVMASPISPLDYLTAARGSPTTPRSPMEEEERAIAEKGFYLHPSPLSTPRGSDPPELLPLFPLQSPRENYI